MTVRVAYTSLSEVARGTGLVEGWRVRACTECELHFEVPGRRRLVERKEVIGFCFLESLTCILMHLPSCRARHLTACRWVCMHWEPFIEKAVQKDHHPMVFVRGHGFWVVNVLQRSEVSLLGGALHQIHTWTVVVATMQAFGSDLHDLVSNGMESSQCRRSSSSDQGRGAGAKGPFEGKAFALDRVVWTLDDLRDADQYLIGLSCLSSCFWSKNKPIGLVQASQRKRCVGL